MLVMSAKSAFAGWGDRARPGRRPVPPVRFPARVRVVVAGVVAVIVLAGPQLGGAALGRQTGGLAAAQAGYDEARDAYDEAATALEEASSQYRAVADLAVAFEEELRGLDARSLQTVLAYETTLSRARELAVDAYVRGGTESELATYLDADASTELLVRLHLMVGRVDQAQVAASQLLTQRAVVDRAARDVAVQVAATGALLNDADAELGRARRREQAAYAELLAATDRLTIARGQAAAAARAVRTPAADTGGGSSGGDSVVPALPDDGQAAAWAKLRDCESGGDYTVVSSDGLYRGAYQFSWSTWASVGGSGDPAAAPPAEQDYRARLLYERSGRGQWPVCGRFLL